MFKVENKINARLKVKGGKNYYNRLNQSQVDTLNIFIQKLKTFDSGGNCTTTEYYTVFTNNGVIKREDRSCEWNGFSAITKTLFHQDL